MLNVPSNRSRWRLAKDQIAGVLHHCVPTLALGALLRLGPRHRKTGAGQGRSIIVFRLDRIGDVVLTSAMLRELRNQFSDAHVTLVVNAETWALVQHCPYVDRVLATPAGRPTLGAAWRFCRTHLHGRQWDLAIVPRWDADVYFATLMCCYTGARVRIAFSEKTSRMKRRLNWGFDRLFTRVLAPGPVQHEAERNLDIVRHLGGRVTGSHLEAWASASDSFEAAKLWTGLGLGDSDTVIALGIGAGDARRQWPACNFAALIQRLAPAARTVLICGPGDHDFAEEVRRHTALPVVVLKKASLLQVAAFLSRCAGFVGNDSGPLHLAVAAGIPVVEISCHPADGDANGENSPERFGPFTRRSRVVRPEQAKHPCRSSCVSSQPHCITQVSVAEVAQEVTSLLSERLTYANVGAAISATRVGEDLA